MKMLEKPTYNQNVQHDWVLPFGSRIVFGTSGLGGVWGEINPDESVQAVLYALENGVLSFDTAPSYANAEIYLGLALKHWGGALPFVSTKVGRLRGENAFDFKFDYSDGGMEKSLHQSLKTLGLEKVDLLFLHEPQCVPTKEIERIISCLHRFKEQGLVTYVGIGGNPTEEFLPFVKRENFDVVSGFLRLDACNLSALNTEIPLLKKQGIIYYAASPLHFSLLGNRLEKYLSDGPDGKWITKNDLLNAKKINQIALKNKMTLSSLSQRYLFSVKEANRVVVGAKNLQQVKQTLDDWNKPALDEHLFNEITDVLVNN